MPRIELIESLVQLRKVAGVTAPSCWCDTAESLVQPRKVTGATMPSRWCDCAESLVRLQSDAVKP